MGDVGEQAIINALATRPKGLDNIHDDCETHETAEATNRGVVSDICEAGGLGGKTARKTVTFVNTDADVTLFTVTGSVIARVIGVCTTNCASAAGCNVSVGVASSVAGIIALTDVTLIAAGEIWHDITPDSSFELPSVLNASIIANGEDIVLDVETAKQVDSGVIEFYCIWTKLSSDGNVVAA